MTQFLSSRPTTPVPFKPKRSSTQALSPTSGLSPLRHEMNGAPKSNGEVEGSNVVANLEKVVNGKGAKSEGPVSGGAGP